MIVHDANHATDGAIAADWSDLIASIRARFGDAGLQALAHELHAAAGGSGNGHATSGWRPRAGERVRCGDRGNVGTVEDVHGETVTVTCTSPRGTSRTLSLPLSDVAPLSGRRSAPGSPAEAAATERVVDDFRSVIERWRAEGPVVHFGTGIPTLDEMTGGGPVPGTRWFVLGCPDSGKTALLGHFADRWLADGLVVGWLAVDEEAGDIVQRLVQRRGWSRADCEARAPADLDGMQAQAPTMLRIYGPAWSIEDAARDLAMHAALASEQQGREVRAAFLADSIQTIECNVELESTRELSERAAVTARVRALRRVATTYRLIVVATCEMARAFYRGESDTLDTLAAGKESSAIEYVARVQLSLRSIEGDLVELRVDKSKHGARHRPDEPGVPLRIDRARQTFTEASDYVPPTESERQAARRAAKNRERDRQTLADAALLATILAEEPGANAGRVEEIATARTPGGMGARRFARARGTLGAALVERSAGRTKVRLYLDGSALATEVAEQVPIERRPMVAAARPPEEESTP